MASDQQPVGTPTVGNPNAASDYVKTVQHRSDLQQAQQFIGQVESAANPQERAQMLLNNGISEEDYARLKAIASPHAAYQHLTPEQQTQMAQQVEGNGGGESVDMPAFNEPEVQAALAVPGLAAGATRETAAALMTFPAWSALGQNIHDTMARNFPNHPRLVQAVDAMMPAAMTAAGLGMNAFGAPSAESGAPATETPAAELVSTKAAPAPENAPAATPEPAAATSEAPQEATAQPAAENPAAEATLPKPAPIAPEVQGAPKSAGEVPHTLAEMTAQARATPFQPEDVRAMQLTVGEEGHQLLSTPIDAMDMLRLHFYTANQVNDAINAARDANNLVEPGAQEKFAEIAKELSDVTIPRWKAGLHQAGLTLRVLGDPASAESANIRAFNDAMDRMKTARIGGAGGPSLDQLIGGIQGSEAPMDQMIKGLAALPSEAEREAMLQNAAKIPWTAKGAIQNLYVNSILSLNSVAKKAVSDTANIIWQVPTRGLAEVGSRATEYATGADYGSMGVAPGETAALTRGMVNSIGDSLRVGGKSFIKNQPMFDSDGVGFLDNRLPPSLMAGSGYEDTAIGRAIDFYGHLVSLPGRSIIGVDQFSKSMQTNMELYALAARQGYQEAAQSGLSGAEAAQLAQQRMAYYIENPEPWMLSQANDAAKTNTFTADLEGSLAKLDTFRQSNFATRTLFPFFKTPVNITLQGIRQSPLALLSPTWRATVAAGGPDAALAMSKAALGSVVLGYLTSKVLEGTITGGPPPNLDKDSRDLWLKDHQPYSVKVGDKWVSHTGLEPLSWLLGATADMAPAFSYLNDGDAQRAASTLTLAFIRQIDHQPMWGALHTLMEALDESNKDAGGKLEEFAGKTAGGFIPSTLANYAGEVDPVKRQTLSALDEIRQRIPWLKNNGIPTLDPFGRPVTVPPGFAWNEFPAFKITSSGKDPVSDEMVRLHQQTGFKPPDIPKSIAGPSDIDAASNPPEQLYGASLTPEEQNRWIELRGNPPAYKGRAIPSLYDAAATLMQTDNYKSASDAARANKLDELFRTYQLASKGTLLAERPDIQLRIASAYKRRAEAMAAGPTAGVAQ